MEIAANLAVGGNLAAKDFIRQNCDQYLNMRFKELKDKIYTKCLFPNSEQEENSLKNWLKDERRRLKKSSTLKNFEDQKLFKNQDTKEQADQIFVEQEDKILSGILTLDGKKKDDFLRLQIDQNFMLLLQFLKNRNSAPNEDFLPRLLNLCQEMNQPQKQTLLFLRICAIHQREILNVDSALIEATLVELSNGAIDQDGAYGLLKISFQNNIPFNSFALYSLIAFQDRYPLQFKRFFNSLNDKIDSQILKCIPATCFLFTKPFFLELKNQGKNFHQNMDYQYLPSIVKLLAYSFESEHETFSELLRLFKEGCLNIFGKGFDLTKLLDSITEQEILRNKLFFGSLQNQITMLNQTFKLIADKKIIIIDSQLIDQLLTMEKKSYLETEQGPRVVGDSVDDEKKYQQYLLLFKQRNKLPELENIDKDQQLSQEMIQLMEHFKIQRLSYIQRAAMIMVSHFFEHNFNKMSLKFETGAGKTTLALLLILQTGLKKVKSFAVNHSFDLCFRDYNKLVPIAHQLGLKVSYIAKLEDLVDAQNSDIFFVQSDIYYEMARKNYWKALIADSLILLDEFDETLFAKGITIEKLSTFGISKWFVSVTGSSLDQIHTQIIQKGLQQIVLDFPHAQQIDGRQNICADSIIFQTRKDQMNYIASVCKEQATKTPVLLIIEKEGHKSFLDVAKHLPLKDLNILNPKEVESFLKSSFLKKVNDSYYICLLNESQGRGLDAPTSFDIETNGGISTIIAKTPSSQQEFDQFKGRTKRMCNKGQHFLFLWEKGIKESCDNFLDYHFGAVRNTELIRLNNILNQIMQHNETITQFNHSKATLNEENSASIEQSSDENNSEESFVEQKSTTKGKTSQKKRQRSQNKEVQHQNESKKRGQKGLSKHNSKQNKQQKDNNNEEYKMLDNSYNESHNSHDIPFNCAAKEENVGMVLDPDNFLKGHINPSLDQIPDVQGELINSEVIQDLSYKEPLLQKGSGNMIPEHRDSLILDKGEENIRKQDKSIVYHNDILMQGQPMRQTRVRNARQTSNEVELERLKSQKESINLNYFGNYSKPKAQQEMIEDKVRLSAYQKAINKLCEGKVVLDLGCGTGILSLYALKAGAQRVIGIDNANISKLLIEDLKQFGNKFQFIKNTIENVAQEDPSIIGQVDVIVSEWMGYFLLYENMIDSYILCIKKFLKPNGIVVPSKAKMFLRAANFDMEKNIVPKKYKDKNASFKLVMNDQCKKEYIISTHSTVKDFNFTKNDIENPLNDGFMSNFSVQVNSSGIFNALVGYFEVELCKENFLSTYAGMDLTHWKQSIFFLNNPVLVKPDDVIEGTINISTAENNHRNLVVKITYQVNQGHGSLQDEVFSFE